MKTVVSASLAFFLLASPAFTQEPKRPGRAEFGPGGGFREFGFGGRGGSQASSTMLLGIPEVLQELGASQEQRKQIDDLLGEVQEAMRSSFGAIDFRDLQNLSDEEREKRLADARRKSEEANKTADEKLAKVLDAKQLERLGQLRLQREGPAAFARPEVAMQLSLTDEQKNKIRAVQEASRQPFGGGFDPAEFARMEESRQKMQAELLAVLTDEQKARWTALKGSEFKFPENPPRFGPGGPMRQEMKLVKQFDKDGNGRLNREERQAAREWLKTERTAGRGGRTPRPPGGGPGGPFGRRNQEPPKPGPRESPTDAKVYPDVPLYEPSVLRTLFLEFEGEDWEAELSDFRDTDVEVPATLIVDGNKYPEVGVHFRGMSSYMMVAAGYKRSLNLTIDFANPDQKLYGYRTINLLNCHDDPSFMGTVLYSHIARHYLPAPKANFAKVVINGESWGVYANAQQFNKDFLVENFKTSKGARWKVRGSPGGAGGLDFAGENVEDYKRRYEIKSGDSEKAWKDLITLCRTLSNTPPEQLEEALKPILDVDSALWFLALDVALINNDGYWVRASDYCIYRDDKGKFHLVPHDMNEAFHPAMGGFGRGPGGPRGTGGPGGRGGRGPGDGPPGGGPGAPAGRPDGGPGGPEVVAAPPPGGEVLPAGLQEALKLTGEQRKSIEELQKEIEARIEKILTEDQRAKLRSLRRGGPAGQAVAGEPGGPPRPGGPGGGPGGGPRGPGLELDPLVGLEDARKPLRSRLLAVPKFRARYLEHVRTIADEWLDWKKLGPILHRYESLLDKEVEADTKKLESYEAFKNSLGDAAQAEPKAAGRGSSLSFRAFADQRRKYLLNHPEIQKVAAPEPKPQTAKKQRSL